MAKQTLRLNNFGGGLSDDDKTGPPNSFSEGQGIDFRTSSSVLTLQKELFAEADETAGVVTKEVTDAVRVSTGDIYMAGTDRLYKRAVSTNGGFGVYSLVGGVTVGCSDLLYEQNLSMILLIGAQGIGEYGPLNGTPAITGSKYAEFTALTQDATGGTYTVPTAISEADADKIPFVCNHDPLYGWLLDLNTKSTGTLVFTIHDAANNVVLQSTRTNASIAVGTITNNSWDFSPSNAGRLNIGSAYHIHVTSSTAGHKLTSTAANTLTAAKFTLKATRLVNMSTSDIVNGPYGHRALQSGSKNYICNERYLAEWEILSTAANTTDGWDAHRLIFPANYVTVGLAEYGDNLAIACAIRNGSDTLEARGGTDGAIFLWDKTSTFYNQMISVPQGVPSSLYSFGNMLYWEARGRLYRWGGGDIETVFEFPGVGKWQADDNAPQSEVFIRAPRNAMAVRDGLLLIGFPFATANLNVKYGVYSYGHKKASNPVAVGYDYVGSNGHDYVRFLNSGVPGVANSPYTAITLVKNFGGNLFVATRTTNNNTSAIYDVDFTNDAQGYRAAGSWASLWFDAGAIEKEKTALAIYITCEPLPTGSTCQPKYRFDRETSWRNDASIIGQPGATIIRLPVPSDRSRFREIMAGFDLTNTPDTGDAPRITSICIEYDDNEDEEYNGD